MATASRYQGDSPRQRGRGVDPFSYAQGIRTPAAPQVPLPPSPAGSAPPGPPTLYEPKTTPGEQRMKGGAKIAMSLADMLNNWSDKVYKQEAMTVKKNAYESGLAYGQQAEGDIELRGGVTVYDQAFNKGARLAYQSAVQLDMREAITKYEIEHPADTNLFDAKASSYRDSILGEITDPETLAFATNKVAEYTLDSRTRILKAETAEDRAQQLSTVQENLDAANRDVGLAIEMGDDAMALNRAALRETIILRAVDADLIKESKAPELINKMREDDAVAIWVRDYRKELEAGKGDEAYEAFIERGLSEQKYPKREVFDEESDLYQKIDQPDTTNPILKDGMTADLHERIRKELWAERGRFNTLQAQDNAVATAALKVEQKQLGIQIDDTVNALDRGSVPPNINEVEQRLAAMEELDPIAWIGWADKLGDARARHDAITEFKKLPLVGADKTQLSVLTEARGRTDLTNDQEILLDKMQSVYDATWSDIRNGDGLLRAVEDGVVKDEDLGELRPGFSALEMTNFLADRDMAAMMAEMHYGVPYIDRLPSDEIAVVADMWAMTSSSDEKARLLFTVVNGLQENALPLLEKLDKANAVSLGVAGSLVLEGGSGPELARQIIKGSELVKDTTNAINPPSNQMNQAIQQEIGLAFSLSGPKATSAIMGAVKNVYAWRAYQRQDWSPEIEALVLKEIVQEVTGGVVEIEWNEHSAFNDPDYKVQVPERGMDSGDMNDWLESITAEDLEQMGGTNSVTPEAETAERIRNGEYKLHAIGGFGQPVSYLLEWHSGAFVTDQNEKPFRLEYKTAVTVVQ
ncbi:hypothetical protein CMI37_09595 [Candidatus Pacearchaeota archaeon]|nr:hypothetical protein [Candidatus Pacearchaeota archaeon]